MQNTKTISSEPRKLLVILVLLLYVTQFFSYVNWGPLTKGLGLTYLFIGLLLLAVVSKRKKPGENFRSLIFLLAFYPFLTVPITLAMYGQSIIDSTKALIPNLFWLSYFVWNRYNFKEQTIIRGLLIFSLAMLAIMVIQQFTYPTAFFGLNGEEYILAKPGREDVSMRNGIYRFLIHQNGYTAVPVLLYFLFLMKTRITLGRLTVFFLMLAAVYMSLTRQVIASCMLVVFLSFITSKEGKIRVKYIILGCCFAALFLFFYSDVLFGEMMESTADDLDEDYIRIFSYLHYWDLICDNAFTFIFGHGLAVSGKFLKLYEYWRLDMGLYSSDVGIIGIWFHYGLIYVLLYFYSLYMLYVHRKKIPMYVILFAVFTGLMSVMVFPFWITPNYYLIWTMMFYICDLHINKEKSLVS